MAHVITVPEKPMLATDRCDRCGAQAWVEVVLGENTLMFCSHHWGGAKDKILAMPEAVVADHTERLMKEEEATR